MKTSQRRAAREKAQHKWGSPVEELGPDYEDEQDIEHQYARDLFEHEQRAQQQGQQR